MIDMYYESAVESPTVTDTFFGDVFSGLDARPRHLPCKYFYDRRGSALFDRICGLDEYYLTRTELSIMRRFAPEMASAIKPSVALIEFGSGSSTKTRLLLDHLAFPVAYVPVDVASEQLQRTAASLSRTYPRLIVLPVCADFTQDWELPERVRDATRTAVYFPGSTIGNLEPDAARAVLARIGILCGHRGSLLIGIDLQKDVGTIEAAYNDAKGVTAEFNKNLLARINRELGGNFELTRFRHRACYNHERDRIEMYLISQRDQVVTIDGERFHFAAGEAISTEYSHKYTIGGFADMAADAGLRLRHYWSDEKRFFAVLHCTVTA